MNKQLIITGLIIMIALLSGCRKKGGMMGGGGGGGPMGGGGGGCPRCAKDDKGDRQRERLPSPTPAPLVDDSNPDVIPPDSGPVPFQDDQAIAPPDPNAGLGGGAVTKDPIVPSGSTPKEIGTAPNLPSLGEAEAKAREERLKDGVADPSLELKPLEEAAIPHAKPKEILPSQTAVPEVHK